MAMAVVAIGYVNAINGKPLFWWRDTVEGLWKNLLLIHAWPPNGAYSWNMPSWSISAEWAAYLVFPILLFVALKMRVWFVLVVIVGWAWFYVLRGNYILD